jgi:hypothetical protein
MRQNQALNIGVRGDLSFIKDKNAGDARGVAGTIILTTHPEN